MVSLEYELKGGEVSRTTSQKLAEHIRRDDPNERLYRRVVREASDEIRNYDSAIKSLPSETDVMNMVYELNVQIEELEQKIVDRRTGLGVQREQFEADKEVISRKITEIKSITSAIIKHEFTAIDEGLHGNEAVAGGDFLVRACDSVDKFDGDEHEHERLTLCADALIDVAKRQRAWLDSREAELNDEEEACLELEGERRKLMDERVTLSEVPGELFRLRKKRDEAVRDGMVVVLMWTSRLNDKDITGLAREREDGRPADRLANRVFASMSLDEDNDSPIEIDPDDIAAALDQIYEDTSGHNRPLVDVENGNDEPKEGVAVKEVDFNAVDARKIVPTGRGRSKTVKVQGPSVAVRQQGARS